MSLLIGSSALKFWYPKLDRYSDYDIIMSAADLDRVTANYSGDSLVKLKNKVIIKANDEVYEIESDVIESNRRLINYKSDKIINLLGIDCHVAPKEVLLAIKRSHRFYTDHWHKNMRDYHFLKSVASLSDDLIEISDIRSKEKHARKTGFPMSMSNETFFENTQKILKRIYDHDDLHYATCYYDEPLWAKCKYDNNSAYIEKDLFDRLSYEDKVKMVQEEAFVIALERKIIPLGWDNRKAFMYAVQRIGTDLCKGWFREFCVENYCEVIKNNINFKAKYEDALALGKIKIYRDATL